MAPVHQSFRCLGPKQRADSQVHIGAPHGRHEQEGGRTTTVTESQSLRKQRQPVDGLRSRRASMLVLDAGGRPPVESTEKVDAVAADWPRSTSKRPIAALKRLAATTSRGAVKTSKLETGHERLDETFFTGPFSSFRVAFHFHFQGGASKVQGSGISSLYLFPVSALGVGRMALGTGTGTGSTVARPGSTGKGTSAFLFWNHRQSGCNLPGHRRGPMGREKACGNISDPGLRDGCWI
ncbi:hypothetical protein G7046_g5788 [Stylonectria norvegica]|nr:hypothetical protein G7046_g5788 [Stylonectria norvegica]